MAAFKGVKERINSVKTTRKITSAMKMVSAAKLNKAQKNIFGMLPYANALHQILRGVLSGGADFDSPLAVRRTPERVAIIAFSSDSSLAGAFNANVIKELHKTFQSYEHLPKNQIFVYTIGKKVFDAVRKLDYTIARNFEGLATKPDYDTVASLAEELVAQFNRKAIDRVEVIHYHFKSAGSQTLMREDFLPLALSANEQTAAAKKQQEAPEPAILLDYILEPSHQEVLAELLPKTLKLKLYTMLLDSSASEHAARMLAMQAATDNADELIGDLTVEYNKSRQQAITNELLDIVGGSMK